MEIEIKVHSFIDIITNSSSEIYVQASSRTIDSVHKLVNAILSMGNSQVKSEDLFEMELIDEGKEERYDETLAWERDRDEWLSKNQGKTEEDYLDEACDGVDLENHLNDYFGYEDETRSSVRMRVKLKDSVKSSSNSEIAIKILGNLTGLFSIDASYG